MEGVLNASLFLKKALKPKMVVDKDLWYSWALQRLGLEYGHQTFGTRNRVEKL